MGARLRRLAGWVVALAVVVEVVWLLAGNLLLSTSMGRDLANRRPERVQMSWQSAWTLWPGHLRVENYELRVRGRKATWALDIDRAAARFDLLRLPARQVRVPRLAAEGVAFRLARRADGEGTAFEDTASADDPTPPFPAFDDLPPRSRKRSENPWRWIFEDAVVDGVHEVWFDAVRYQPTEEAAGSLRFGVDVEPRDQVAVRHAQVDLEPGSLRLGDESIGAVRRARFDGRLEPFGPESFQRGRWLRSVFGVLELIVDDASVAPVSHYFRGMPVGLRGDGDVDAVLHLRGAVLEAPSRLDVTDARLAVDFGQSTAEGSGRVDAHVEADVGTDAGTGADGSPRALLHLELDDYRLGRRGADATHLVGTSLTLDGSTTTLDLLDPNPDIDATVTVEGAQIPDFAAYGSYLPEGSPISLTGGTGRLDATLRFRTAEKRASATVRLVGEAVRGRWKAVDLQGDVLIDASMPEGTLAGDHYQIGSATAELTNVRVGGESFNDGARGPWWLRARLDGGTFAPTAPLELETTIDASCADTRPLLALLAGRKRAAWLAETLVVKDLDLSAGLRTDNHAVIVHDLHLRGGKSLEALAGLRFVGEHQEGALWISWGPVAAAVALDGDRTDWDLRHSKRWYQKKVEALGLAPSTAPD